MQCTIKETSIIRGLMDNVENFCTQAEGFLKMDDSDESIPLDKVKVNSICGRTRILHFGKPPTFSFQSSSYPCLELFVMDHFFSHRMRKSIIW